jgi:DNA-binding XRE family transcriptional regulator
LREKFEGLVPVQAIARVPSGSPANYVLSADQPFTRTVSAAEALAKRHLSLLQAKRIVERMMRGETVAVEVPMVEDAAAFEGELARNGVRAERRDPPEAVDVKAVRERLGLSQDEFAVRFGLDAASLRNWEQGRTRPDRAVRALLKVIEREPEAVERALAS